MAGHAQLKFVMTECPKTQICLTRSVLLMFPAGYYTPKCPKVNCNQKYQRFASSGTQIFVDFVNMNIKVTYCIKFWNTNIY